MSGDCEECSIACFTHCANYLATGGAMFSVWRSHKNLTLNYVKINFTRDFSCHFSPIFLQSQNFLRVSQRMWLWKLILRGNHEENQKDFHLFGFVREKVFRVHWKWEDFPIPKQCCQSLKEREGPQNEFKFGEEPRKENGKFWRTESGWKWWELIK